MILQSLASLAVDARGLDLYVRICNKIFGVILDFITYDIHNSIEEQMNAKDSY